MSMRVLRKRTRTKTQNRPTPALSFTLKPAAPLGSGAHARYALVVAPDGGINREAWARVVSSLRQEEAKGKTAPFARKVGVDARTVDRWLRQQVAVKEENIRAVARALGRSPMDLLVRVGYYEPGEVAPPTPVDPRDDQVVQMIMADPQWTEEERMVLVERELLRIKGEQERRIEEYVSYVRQRRGEREERGTA
jgi:transcriptional regulator with XRE-family HTH domain